MKTQQEKILDMNKRKREVESPQSDSRLRNRGNSSFKNQNRFGMHKQTSSFSMTDKKPNLNVRATTIYFS